MTKIKMKKITNIGGFVASSLSICGAAMVFVVVVVKGVCVSTSGISIFSGYGCILGKNFNSSWLFIASIFLNLQR